MHFPVCSFPTSVCPHNGYPGCQNRDFAEYGSFSQVNCYSLKDQNSLKMKCYPQKGMGIINGLGGNLPPLPLHSQSLSECLSIQDQILGVGHYEDAIKSAKFVFEKSASILRRPEKYFQKLNSCLGQIDQCLSEPENIQHWNSINEALPTKVKDVFRNYVNTTEASNENCMIGFNRDFYQGLLCHKQSSDSTLLFHASGEKFKDICMTVVPKTDECIPQGIPATKVTLNEPIFQLNCSKKGVLCARQENQCVVLMYDETANCLEELTQTAALDEKLSDVAFSPYNKDELLVSSIKGQVCLWNFDSGSCVSFEKVAKSDCPLPWTSCHFAGHPRQIVVSDCFSMEIFDHRDRFSKGVELFHLSDSLVKSHERVMATSFLGFPYHLVATDFTLFVIDQRFPNNPVLQWSTQTSNPSLYIKSCKLSNVVPGNNNEESEHFIFLGTQQPAEVVCFPLNVCKGDAPVTKTLPWSVGKIGDFVNNETISYQPLWQEADKHYQTSLAGMTAVAEPSGGQHIISVYQMDGYGDIFFQNFKLTPMIGDSGSYSLALPTVEEKAAANCRATNFLSSLDDAVVFNSKQQSSLSKSDHKESLAYADVERLIASGPAPAAKRNLKDMVTSFRSFSRSICSTEIKDPFVRLNALSKKGPNTRLLLALKENGDIQDVIQEREENYAKQKKHLREQYLIRKERARMEAKRVKAAQKK